MIVSAASAASAGFQFVRSPISMTSRTRSSTPNAAAFVATAMNAVTGVGAPSYTSGVHWWNGAIEALKQRPTTTSATPVSSNVSELCPWLIELAIALKSVAPVAP